MSGGYWPRSNGCGQIDGRSMGEHGVHSWNHAALVRAVDRLEALP